MPDQVRRLWYHSEFIQRSFVRHQPEVSALSVDHKPPTIVVVVLADHENVLHVVLDEQAQKPNRVKTTQY